MKKTASWFTLIELMIAITIFLILVMMTYANYTFYQNIAKVKLSLKEISQSLSRARNMASSWYQKDNINQKIWVLFEKEKNIIKYYNFNYNSWVILDYLKDDVNLLKQEYLQQNIKISNISLSWSNDLEKVLVVFSSIYWTWWFYKVDTTWITEMTEKEINFTISFKNANSFPLKRWLDYNKITNISDY